MKSIITKDLTKCYLCGSYQRIEIHHIYSGCYRKKSTQYGLVVPLCYNCHQGTNGVHFNRLKMDKLRAIGQKAFEREYPDLDFVKIFGRNYESVEERELIDLDD